MPKAIKDKFSNLPVSRQRKYQLRMARDRRCVICGESAVGRFYCLKHMVKVRERARRKIGAKKRSKGARSYRLEQEMKVARRRRFKK
jgi:tRNA(Ile)-lysidine synthase TilS/MesJ